MYESDKMAHFRNKSAIAFHDVKLDSSFNT